MIVNRQTGHVLNGHLRVNLAIEHGEREVDVIYVDLTEAEERLVLATFDQAAKGATVNGDPLGALLAEIEEQSSPVQRLLDELRLDGDVASLMAEIEEQLAGGSTEGSGWHLGESERESTIRPVMWVRELATVESVLQMAGQIDRGEALVAICRFYLEHNG